MVLNATKKMVKVLVFPVCSLISYVSPSCWIRYKNQPEINFMQKNNNHNQMNNSLFSIQINWYDNNIYAGEPWRGNFVVSAIVL